jgi:wyosine [tRNA(Phe)-imidazoG37] synthetase (radical SAM superfamily)
LGRSLGINNIPPKVCSYACVYCQVGSTTAMRIERRPFYAPPQILASVQEKLAQARAAGERVDFLAFVPDGEPTLDVNLGQAIALLRPLGVPVAVISNASLIGRVDVRRELALADWVSLKVDAVQESTWHRINRAHRKLSLTTILAGARAFAAAFAGTLVTETMLVAGVNDGEADLKAVARFLGELRPATAYISAPTRPPVEPWATGPDEQALVLAYQAFARRVARVEYLIEYEGDDFASLGEPSEALLGILAVHPMLEVAVRAFLARAGASQDVLEHLVARGQVTRASHRGQTFYARRSSDHRARGVQPASSGTEKSPPAAGGRTGQ